MLNRYSENSVALNEEALQWRAPSIFARRAMEGVSAKYSFLPTIEVVRGLRREGWEPVQAFEQRIRLDARRGFQKHVLRFQRRDQLCSTSEYRPEVVLINSHDRSSAYQIHAGLFRLVCSNGLIIADTTFDHISIRHAGFEPEQVIAASFKVLNGIPQLTENVESFRARPVTSTEQKALAEAALILKYDDLKKAPVGPEKLLQSRRYEDVGDNLWNTFNRVQENLLQGGLKDYSRQKDNGKFHPRTRPVTGIDENVKLNKALWHLAEALQKGAGVPTH